MKLRGLAAIYLLTFAATAAHSQIGIYGKLDATHFSNNNQQTTTWFYGPGLGVYYNFLHAGPIALGADVRGNLLWGDSYRYRSALFGLRLAAKPPLLPIRPYIQGSVGVGGPKYTGPLSVGISSSPYQNKFQYQVLGGIDFAFLPHIDLRLPEIGYGRMSGVGGGPNTPASTLFNLSTGIVIRLP